MECECISWNTLLDLYSNYSENKIIFQHIINYKFTVEVVHYLGIVDIYLMDERYTDFPAELIRVMDEFSKIGEVFVNENNLSIRVCLDFLRIFLKQNKPIKIYYRIYSNDSEENIYDDINKVYSIGIDIKNIYTDTDSSNDNLNELILESTEGDVIYIFSIARSVNSFEEIVYMIYQLREKNVDLVIGDMYFSPSLRSEILIEMILNLKHIYETECRSLKIKKGQQIAFDEDGKKIGRPKVDVSDLPGYVFENYKLLKNGEINMSQFADMCGVTRPTAYKYKKMIEKYDIKEE